jgi:hypothetical protein
MIYELCVPDKMFMLQVSTAGQTWIPVGPQLKRQILSVPVMISYVYEWFMLSG